MDPYKRLEEFRKRLEKLFQGLEDKEVGIFEIAKPHLNAYKERGKYVYEFEMPGFDKKDIAIYEEGGALVIDAEKKSKEKKKGKNYFYAESMSRALHREVPLPQGSDIKKINAQYKNGVLRVEIPVKGMAKKKKAKIKVK